MIRLWLIVVVAAVAFTVYAAIDCATMPRERVRSLRRGVWILLVIVLPVLGAVLWFLLGRAPATEPGGGSGYRGPEDDPDFLGGPHGPEQHRTDKDQDDETLRDLEQQFRERDRRDRERRDRDQPGDDGRSDR
ncbi:Phospholipase_D-nuclease N-terminal [Curtobacterium sp. UNCCL20]|uniref:PLD nuclease N-terminal domain-containing protein n=1 Tax=Curtobacterium sp. UNCCL20 TaxID=1502773 RepID=UPI00089276E2|nr:PLD nuclease N-terminal domain-containing protein [Curtobacterium sp. UNCCL20]SDQ69181.1 Phospholipase_D-nuclease N-terminal [Curtobacterium sp. UNCCL20]